MNCQIYFVYNRLKKTALIQGTNYDNSIFIINKVKNTFFMSI